jgi:hypothetical protein
MRPRVLLVNGPPRAGKDSFGKLLKENFQHVYLGSFAWALKVRTHGLYGCPEAPAGAFEDVKDAPNPIFLGLTPRQAYIAVSERFYKKEHGDDVWGKILCKSLQWADTQNAEKGVTNPLYVITDSGFAKEARCLIEFYGKADVALVRLHREGCDFSRDSRSYIELPELAFCRDVIANNMDELETCAFALAAEWSLTPREESLGKLIQFPLPKKSDSGGEPRPASG